MKVLMFGWEYPPYNSGGLGVACQGLAKALVAQNIELVFVLPKRLGDFAEPFRFRFANIGNLSITEINSLLVPYITSEKYKLLANGVEPGGQYCSTLFEEVKRYALLAKRIAESESFDVVHAHDWLSFGAGIAASAAKHTPFVAHVHATEVDRTAGKPNRYIFEREREGVLAADKVVSVSGFTKQVLVNEYGIDPGKIEVVHNGISVNKYSGGVSGIEELKKLGYKIVLFVGRITIMKGADYLLYAAKKVLTYDPKVIFVIAGAGDMEGQIMRQAAELGISNKVLFPGFLRGSELSAAYASADLFVMPSVAEPFGMVPLESLLHGTPVLISKTSGVSEVLKNALKTDFWDVEDMADKILSVIKYKSLHDELAVNGARDASVCNWEAAANKCIGIYNSLL
ncbi:hypothetical protein A2803_03330 [Candidatus Woesebacteria bacterium RIFCSPHIGHO2_01_FULL_44_21]|uniref:4-alpha-glucanotransferase n=1 Tax=Candidatus Woesebacteria bacterium RIFCSPHIGHO2_01_FULL_44_21 TaxID=1802503 RepID=A0A1F7YYQ0_9BACT|nr:MAG: hypothetical protein A2803_03330 [Candidatus Woesebacteria bacterium RIFCSPHIGHO2_01_FULL_44_21]OGM69134.1 MAG: hypothetical protein A2897_04910 [Candidatus Woesebacteria bacterium RIFCSPLOWO2_01_FULL_44_24b]